MPNTHAPIQTHLSKMMNALAEGIDTMINGKGCPQKKKKYGFALLIFEFDDKGRMPDDDEPRVNYISNAPRRHMLTALKEFIARSEGRHIQPEKDTIQ